MLRTFLLFFCSSSIAFALQAQSIRVEYVEESKREFPPRTGQEAINFMRFTQTILTTNAAASWYEALGEKSFTESLDTKNISPELLQKLPLKDIAQTNVRSSKSWTKNKTNEYKSFTANQSASYMQVGDQKFHVEDSLHAYDWTVTADTATIAGMLCKKATAFTKKKNMPV